MARESPADKLKRMTRVTAAWERLSPGSTFYRLTLTELKKHLQGSYDTRAEIEDLQKSLRAAIVRRDAADARSLRLVRGVV